MNVAVTAETIRQLRAEWLVVGVFEDESELGGALAEVDSATGGLVSALRGRKDITGKPNELTTLFGTGELAAERVLVIGLGKRDALGAGQLFKAAVSAARHISSKKHARVAYALLGEGLPKLDPGRRSATIVQAAMVGSQGQDLYRAEKKRHPFDELVLVVPEREQRPAAEAGAREGEIVGRSINLARQLVNEPPRVLYPDSFARRAEQIAETAGLMCEVWDERRLADERMGGILGVGSGSAQPPRLVVLQGRRGTSDRTLVLVGKGVTFDSGGLSLKESEQMEHMKGDMAGAAAVLASMQAMAELAIPVNVLGILGLTENMPSGTALKVGDVLTARNGKTIEVLNTDAEGRLVLADCLSYAVDRGASEIVDLATLTGSCMVALGTDVSGLMTNNEAWAARVRAAAAVAGEEVWPLPMFDEYRELIKSEVADIKNVGGKYAGAISAAKFLENFVGEIPWVHLDIAGPAWAANDNAWRDSGGTGCFVRTLIELARGYHG